MINKALANGKKHRKKASGRGGARANSGPKAGPDGPLVSIAFALTMPVVSAIEQRAKRAGESRSSIVRPVLEREFLDG